MTHEPERKAGRKCHQWGCDHCDSDAHMGCSHPDREHPYMCENYTPRRKPGDRANAAGEEKR